MQIKISFTIGIGLGQDPAAEEVGRVVATAFRNGYAIRSLQADKDGFMVVTLDERGGRLPEAASALQRFAEELTGQSPPGA